MRHTVAAPAVRAPARLQRRARRRHRATQRCRPNERCARAPAPWWGPRSRPSASWCLGWRARVEYRSYLPSSAETELAGGELDQDGHEVAKHPEHGRLARPDPLDQQHLRLRALLAQSLGRAVLRGGPPGPRLGRGGKLQNHQARRLPGALEHLGGSAAHQVAPAVGRDRGRCERLVALVGGRVLDGDLHHDVGRHGCSGAHANARRCVATSRTPAAYTSRSGRHSPRTACSTTAGRIVTSNSAAPTCKVRGTRKAPTPTASTAPTTRAWTSVAPRWSTVCTLPQSSASPRIR